MKATIEELKAFAENVMALCNHQVSKNRPLSNISIDCLARQFVYQSEQKTQTKTPNQS